MAEIEHTRELDSFKKTILSMVPDAIKLTKSALKMRRNTKTRDGKPIKRTPIQPKSLDLAKYVLEQYAKMVMPSDTDVHELHFIDHAALAQMQKANDIVAELNAYQRSRSRGLDVEPN